MASGPLPAAAGLAAHRLGRRRLLAVDDDHVGDGHALPAVGRLLLAGHSRGPRDVLAALALPGRGGADSAPDRLVGGDGGLLLLLAVEQGGDRFGEDFGSWQADAGDAGRHADPRGEAAEHAADRRVAALLALVLLALAAFGIGMSRNGGHRERQRKEGGPEQNLTQHQWL